MCKLLGLAVCLSMVKINFTEVEYIYVCFIGAGVIRTKLGASLCIIRQLKNNIRVPLS